MGYRPGHDNDEVQLVPLVAEVTIGAKNSQRHHLDDHFHGKESKDAIIQYLQKNTQVELRQSEQEDIIRQNKVGSSFKFPHHVSIEAEVEPVEVVAKNKFLSPLVRFIPAGNSSGLAWLRLCLN